MKKILILKESKTKIRIFENHIEIKTPYEQYPIAKKFIKAIYLNKAIKITIGKCYQLSKIAPLFLIDENGYILSSLQRIKK